MSTTNTASETVLVVEDESSVCEFVRRVLEARGYHVLIAATPHEAVAVAEKRLDPIHLLMTDVALPGMTAGSLANQLQGSRPDMAVIFMSGHSRDEIQGQVRSGTPFLQKPFSTSAALTRTVRAALDA